MARTLRVAAPTTARLPLGIVSVRVAAERYGTTRKVIYGLIAAGVLPAARPPGTKSYAILLSDLDRVYAPVTRTPDPSAETDDQRAERQLAAAGIA